MRTTVTLEPDVEALIAQAMRDRGLTFKEAVNTAIRAGMNPSAGTRTTTFPTHDMGEPFLDVTKAVRLAGEFEDHQLAGRLTRGA